MIKIGRSLDVDASIYDDGETVRKVHKRLLIGAEDGAANFAMRRFTVEPGGHTPYHTHPWEHEVYVLAGQGDVKFTAGSQRIVAGDYVFVPPMDEHQFVNTGEVPFEILCVVPMEGES